MWKLPKRVPKGCIVVNAEQVLPFKSFKKLLNCDRLVQNISDAVRALGVERLRGGIWSDGDMLVLSRMETRPIREAPGHGAFAATAKAHPSTRLSPEADLKRWELDYTAQPQDRVYISTPIGLTATHPVLQSYVSWARSTILNPAHALREKGERLGIDSFLLGQPLPRHPVACTALALIPIRSIRIDVVGLNFDFDSISIPHHA